MCARAGGSVVSRDRCYAVLPLCGDGGGGNTGRLRMDGWSDGVDGVSESASGIAPVSRGAGVVALRYGRD